MRWQYSTIETLPAFLYLRSVPGSLWVYMFAVTEISECPMSSFAILMGTPCFLEVGAESMAKTVRGEVWSNRVLYDLIPPKFCSQFYVQVPREGVPKALETL